MISGAVNARREPVVRLELRSPQGERQEIEVIIDTGFNGFLTLPHAVIVRLALPYLGRGRAILADGREVLLEIYEGVVVWDGQPRAVEADATPGAALLGMGMLEGNDLWIRAIEGGTVRIEALR